MKITFMNPKGSSAESDAFTTNPLRRYIAFGDATSRYIVESLPDEDLTLHTRALLESLLRDVNDFEDGEFARLAVAAASSLHEVPCPKVDESTGNALPPPTRIGARRFLVVIAMQAGLLGLRLSVLGEVEKAKLWRYCELAFVQEHAGWAMHAVYAPVWPARTEGAPSSVLRHTIFGIGSIRTP